MLLLHAKKFNITFLVKDICPRNAKISIREILSMGELKSYINKNLGSSKIRVTRAINLFDNGILKGIYNATRLFRSIGIINVDSYFVTPFGVLWEEDLVIPYKECLDKLPWDIVSELVGKNKDKIYEIIEEEPDFLLIYLDHRLIKQMDLLSYISKNTLTIILSDVYLTSKKDNISVITISKRNISKFKKLGIKISQSNFVGAYFELIAQIFLQLYQEMGKDKFILFIDNQRVKPREFLSLFIEPDLIAKLRNVQNESLSSIFGNTVSS